MTIDIDSLTSRLERPLLAGTFLVGRAAGRVLEPDGAQDPYLRSLELQ